MVERFATACGPRAVTSNSFAERERCREKLQYEIGHNKKILRAVFQCGSSRPDSFVAIDVASVVLPPETLMQMRARLDQR